MAHILTGIDGSDGARTALAWSGTAAQALGARVRLLGAWQYPSTVVFPTADADLQGPDQVDKRMRAELEGLAREVLPEGVGFDVDVTRGPAADALIRSATRAAPVAIVLGTRGLGAFEGMVLGSVSRHCLEHSPAPVVLVPPAWHASATAPRRIVVGVDGSPGAAKALEWATELAAASGAEVLAVSVLLHDQAELRDDVFRAVVAVAEDDLDGWCDPLRARSVEHRPVLLKGEDPRDALVDLAAREDADLIVVGARGTGRLNRLLLGSVASAVTRHSPVPVAVVPHAR
jgi:nucleotide-binding universal stress UspA family protein